MEKVTCIVANVWTSKGKLLKGQSDTVPKKEAEMLAAAGKVEREKNEKN